MLSLSVLFMAGAASADSAEYFVGKYTLSGYDHALEEKYKGEVIFTENPNAFLNITIKHENAGIYYGHAKLIDTGKLKIDYWNQGKQPHSTLCHYENSRNNTADFLCTGNLLGNIGGNGSFTMRMTWDKD